MICWMHITSGRGPDECCWVVAQVLKRIVQEASVKGYTARIVETTPGRTPGILKSAVVALEGDDEIISFLSQWGGTLQWIGKSPFRPHHRRKNWFVRISILHPPPPQSETLEDKDLKIEHMRASGPGGQHANTTDSAVRITHLPTGVSAVAQEERSQYFNRKLALSRLYQKLRQQNDHLTAQFQHEQWGYHNTLERGNPVRIYEGIDFRCFHKSHRE